MKLLLPTCLSTLCAISLSACDTKPPAPHGTYLLVDGVTSEQLSISPDGEFKQIIGIQGSEMMLSGKWSLSTRRGLHFIKFAPFLTLTNGGAEQVDASIHSIYGEDPTIISVDPDAGVYFREVPAIVRPN